MSNGQPSDKRPSVMVVDDDMAQRIMAREALEQARFAAEEPENGQRNLAVIESTRPDIVLLDVMMPVLDRFALCTRLRYGSRRLFLHGRPGASSGLSGRTAKSRRTIGAALGACWTPSHPP